MKRNLKLQLWELFGVQSFSFGTVPKASALDSKITIETNSIMKNCPICGWEGEEFLPCNPNFAHDDSRQLATHCKCPTCHSHHRHRGYMLILQTFNLPKTNTSLLHVAPEPFLNNYFKQRASQYTIIDKNPDKYEKDYETVIEMDLTALTFANNRYDFIYCSHVLEHIPNDKKAISEIYRVLKPGGIAMLTVPIYPLEKTADLYPKSPDIMTHVHQPGLDYFKRYEKAGFSVNVYYPENLFDKEKYGLRTGWDPVALCHKSKNPLMLLLRQYKALT